MDAGTFFYHRTLYQLLGSPPACFIKLDERFAALGLSLPDAVFDARVKRAENRCRRMADIDYFANSIERTQLGGAEIPAQAVIISTLLASHLSSCKAILDAAAIILTTTDKSDNG